MRTQYIDLPLSSLALSIGGRKIQSTGGISTLGELEAWLRSDCKPSIRGVGNYLISEVSKALEDYLIEGTVVHQIENNVYRQIPLNSLKLSVRCMAFQVKGGISTLGELEEWFQNGCRPRIKNIGKGSIAEARAALEGFFGSSLSNKTIPFNSDPAPLLDRLDPRHLNIPIESLHLGNRGHQLRKNEIHTLKDLIDWYNRGHPALAAFGKKSVDHTVRVIDSLSSNIDAHGDPNWPGFCREMGIAIIPEENSRITGNDLLEKLPSFVDSIISSHADAMEEKILRDRLTKTSNEKSTLDEIGSKFGVTREAIRIVEKKLLNRISEGLLFGAYEESNFRFRDELSSLWKKAYDALGEADDLDSELFFDSISSNWNVSRESLVPHFAFIFAVLTSKATVPKHLRVSNIPKLCFKKLPEVIVSKPFRELPLGRGAAELEKEGIGTLGELVQSFTKNSLPAKFSRDHAIFEWLEKFNTWLDKHSMDNFNWESYHSDTATIVPEQPCQSERAFISILKPILETIVKEGNFWLRSSEVLQFRLFPLRDQRLTLQSLGDRLGIPGPTVSKIEKYICKRFQAVLLENDQTKSVVFPRVCVLKYWKEIQEVHDGHTDFVPFKYALASRWNIQTDALDEVIDVIWSVLTLHPHGRKRGPRGPRGSKKKLSMTVKSPQTGFVIKLRPRREVH